MDNWDIFITLWILLQCIVKAARQPYLGKLQGKSDYSIAGAIAGCILWGCAMIAALYMGGLYA